MLSEAVDFANIDQSRAVYPAKIIALRAPEMLWNG
jgi:hypothetical protein